MDLRIQRGKGMYLDEYNFIYTLNGKNKEGTTLYWTYARKKTCCRDCGVVVNSSSSQLVVLGLGLAFGLRLWQGLE